MSLEESHIVDSEKYMQPCSLLLFFFDKHVPSYLEQDQSKAVISPIHTTHSNNIWWKILLHLKYVGFVVSHFKDHKVLKLTFLWVCLNFGV
jgi:hypothetical protein